jgi:phage shock protein A
MKAGDLLNTLLKSAGFDTTDKAFIDVLSKAEFANTDIPESVSNALTNNLMTLESAKNNPLLKKHYYGNALQPINEGVERLLNEFGIDEATRQELIADPNTYAKYEKAVKKIAELKEKSAGAGNKTDKAEYEKQILELNQKVANSVKETQTKIAEVTSQYENKIMDMGINYTLSSKPLPGQFDRDVEVSIARQFVDKKLAALSAILVNENGTLVLKQKANPEMNLFVDNKPLSFDALTDMALAENKFIKVSDPNNGGGNSGFNPTPNRGPQAPTQNQATQSAISNLDIALEGVK